MPHATPSCLVATAAAIACTLAAPALAQQFPNRPIRLIAPSSTGSGVDLVSRMLAVPLSAELGQQIVVDNRAGAGGYIGADLAAKATPNGYTIIMGTPSQVINAAVYKNLSRNLQKEFAPISLATSGQYVLLVNNSVPAKTPAQFIALAKSKPGQIAYGSAGKGNVTHLTGELFQHAAGVKLLHVPFKGSGPGFVGIMGGEIQAMVANIAAAIPHMRAGKVHAIASTGAKRAGVAPDLPTFAESGLKDFEVASWFGLLAPQGTPREALARLHTATQKVLNVSAMREQLARQGLDPVGSSPTEFAAYLDREADKWERAVKIAAVQAQ